MITMPDLLPTAGAIQPETLVSPNPVQSADTRGRRASAEPTRGSLANRSPGKRLPGCGAPFLNPLMTRLKLGLWASLWAADRDAARVSTVPWRGRPMSRIQFATAAVLPEDHAGI